MPIYEQSYRRFEGGLVSHWRWWIMAQQETRVLLSMRSFLILMVLGFAQFFFRLVQIVGYSMLASNPSNPLTMALRQIDLLSVDNQMYFDFLRLQAGFVFVMTIATGSGFICNDFRYNLTEIYFSKPLSWKDYVFGKVSTLVILGLTLTAVPALVLNFLYVALIPSWEHAYDALNLVIPIVVFSLSIVLSCTLGVLASSALFTSQRFASIAVFMVLLGNVSIVTVLAGILRKGNLLAWAYPMTLNRIGESLFEVRHKTFTVDWQVCMVYVLIVCTVCLWIICQRVRKAGSAI